jgi:TonB family protein
MTLYVQSFTHETTGNLPPAGAVSVGAEFPGIAEDHTEAGEAIEGASERHLDGDVETEIPAYLGAPRRPAPPRTTIAIGPFRVRPAVLAWGGSLAVHGALAAASLIVISWLAWHAPAIDGPGWGDGAAETGLIDTPGPVGGAPGALVEALPTGPAPSADARPTLSNRAQADVAEPVVSDATPEVRSAEDADDEPVAQNAISSSALQGLESLASSHAPPAAGAHLPAATSDGQANGSAGSANATGSAANSTPGAAGVGNPAGPAGGGAGRTGDGGGLAYSGRPGSPDGVRGRRGGLARPVYPDESRRRGEQGTVVLAVEVRPDGTVGDVRVANDPGYPRLVAAAVAQVKREHFTPLIEDGRAVPYRLTIPYDFRLRS